MLAHVTGRTDVPLLEETIGAALRRTARAHPDALALVSRHQGVRMSYAELDRAVDALACGLRRLGLAPGERVGIWAPNCAEWTLTQFATARAGLILVNVNPAYRAHELEHALTAVGCRALVMAPSFKSSDYVAMLAEARAPALEHRILIGEAEGFVPFESLTGAPTGEELGALDALPLSPSDPINIQFTSGTTGSPKGATLTHRGILNNGRFVVDCIGLREREALCIPVPLYHCFGMVMGNLGCVTRAAAMVYPAPAFEPEATLRAVEEEGCAGLYAVPTMYLAMLDLPGREGIDISSLRTGIMAGSACPMEVMKRVISELGMRDVTIAYGMTETSPVSMQTAPDDPIEARVATVGRVQPHCEVRIVGEDGATLGRGETGELCTRGYLVMSGYWGDAARTEEAIRDGWMHTGDLATIDEGGYCRIVGRSKDMVIRGGENVYPREIEEFLYAHPGINDVAVVGVPDARYGEELCACVIARGASLDAEDVRAFCRGRIAHFKVPRHVVFVDAFPMTVTGKVQKYLLAEEMAARLAQ